MGRVAVVMGGDPLLLASAYSSSHASVRGGGVCEIERRRRRHRHRPFCFLRSRQCLATAFSLLLLWFGKDTMLSLRALVRRAHETEWGSDVIDAVCVLSVEWLSVFTA